MNEIPTTLFIFMVFLMLVFIIISMSNLKIMNIISGILSIVLTYILSKISINGMLVIQFGGISSADTIITDTISITNLPMSYVFLFLAVVSVIITVINILNEIKYNIEPDLEGDFDL